MINGAYSRAILSWSVVARFQVRVPSARLPFGRFVFAFPSTARTSSRLSPKLFRSVGFTSTRTAGDEPPPTKTCPTPLIWDTFCWRIVDAASYMSPTVMVGEVSPNCRMGGSAGLFLRHVGFVGKLA